MVGRVFDDDIWWQLLFFKPLIPGLEIFPKREPAVIAMACQVLITHSEGKKMNAEEFLTAFEGRVSESIDFLDFGVGHGQATDGDVRTMNHDEAPGSSVGFVEAIGIPDVEREMEVTLRVHLIRGDEVESLGDLSISLAQLWTGAAGSPGDMISVEKGELSLVFGPKLELSFFFEGPEKDGRSPLDPLVLESLLKPRGDFFGSRLKSFGAIGIILGRNLDTLCARGGVDTHKGKTSNWDEESQ